MISFVYFDVGGVLIYDISDDASWNQYKKDLKLARDKYDDFDHFWDEYETELNTKKPVDELVPLMKELFNLDLPNDYSLQRELLSRFQKKESIWPIVEEIKKHCKVGLLTNMYPGMLEAIYKEDLMPPTDWDVVVNSSIVGFQKPDKGIYEVAQKMADTPASEILFIDNSKRNVQAAKDNGWQALLYDPVNVEDSNNEILKVFNNLYTSR